jgi:hypothetical protein
MYYPKSQIKTNLYTNGDEYVLSTTKEPYEGSYYEVSNGKTYTGKSPQDGPNTLLILAPTNLLERQNTLPTFESPSPENPNIIYPVGESILGTQYQSPIETIPSRSIPQFNPTLPTDQDKQNGLFTRYFCAKTNELRYFEIDKLTYDKLNTRDKQIAWDLYIAASVVWRIKGDKEQVYKSNKGAIISLERNLRWAGFPQYFRDKFLQYYLES